MAKAKTINSKSGDKKPQNKTEKDVLDETLRRFDDWRAYDEGFRKTRERDWKLRHGKRWKQAYKGVSDTTVPMAHSLVETMAAALGNGRPAFDYEPQWPLTEFDAKPLNALVDAYWDMDQCDIKAFEAIDQNLGLGSAPVYFWWNKDRPCWENLGLEDVAFDPTLKSPAQLLNGEGWAGRRYLTTVDDLKKFQVVDDDPNSKTYGKLKPRFTNLDKLSTEGGATDEHETDKAYKEQWLGSTLPNADKRQVSVIEIWDADRVVCVANRKVIIEDVENPHKAQHRLLLERKYMQIVSDTDLQEDEDLLTLLEEAKQQADKDAQGIIPFALARNYTDVSILLGRSEIDPVADPIETLNDLTNQNVDAVTWTLLPGYTLDPKYASWINKIGQPKPGRGYPFPEGAFAYLPAPAIPANAFNERQNIKAEIRETTAIDQTVKGVGQDSDVTATEIKAQLNQAGQRIEIKARKLEKDFFFQIGMIYWNLIKLYVTEPVDVLVQTDAGKQPGVFDPAVYADMDLRPKVTLEIMAQQKREQERRDAIESYQMFIADPTNNLAEVKRLFLPKIVDLDAEQIEKIITPAPMDMMGAMGPEMPADGQMPPVGAAVQPQGVPA